MKCQVWAVVALKTLGGTMVVTHTAQELKTAPKARRLLTGQSGRHCIPLGQQPGNPPGFFPGGLVIGKAAQLASPAGVIADFVGEVLVAGDGAGAPVNLHPRVALEDSFYPAAPVLHRVECS